MPETTTPDATVFEFADLRMDVGRRLLTRDGKTVNLGKLSFRFLHVLAEASPNLVTHDELIGRVWGPKRIVTPDNLGSRVLLLRKALGDDATGPRYIEVVRGQGFRLIPAVRKTIPPQSIETTWSVPKRRWLQIPELGRLAIVLLPFMAVLAAMMLPDAEQETTGNASRRPVVFELSLAPEAPFVPTLTTRSVGISRDGSHLAYMSSNDTMIVRALDAIDSIRIDNLGTGARLPVFSPDGSRIAYYAGSQIRVVSADGRGAPIYVVPAPPGTHGDFQWLDDGSLIVAGLNGVFRIGTEGRSERIAAADAQLGESSLHRPSLLPGGRGMLVTVAPVRLETGMRVAVIDLATGERRYLLSNATQPVFIDDGYLVFATGGELKAIRFDPVTYETGSEQITVARGLMVTPNGAANFSISDDGTVVHAVGGMPPPAELVWVDREGNSEVLAVPPLNYFHPRISPDGRHIALDVRWPGSDIWIWDLDRSVLNRITNDLSENVLPAWSPEGSRVYFGDGRAGVTNTWAQDFNGGGSPYPLSPSGSRQLPFSVTPDGASVLLGETRPNGKWQIMNFDLGSGEKSPLLSGEYSYWNTDVSPDGNWVAYQSDESGSLEVYVRPYPDVEAGRWKISANGGTRPKWGRAGDEILYVSPEQTLMRVAVSTAPEFRADTAHPLIDLSAYQNRNYDSGARHFDLSPDNERILITRDAVSGEAGESGARIVVSVNWIGERLASLDASVD